MATVGAETSHGPSMKLKIVVNKKKNRVLFAEAKKDFVDFLFHILSLPLGAVHRILSESSDSFGSIGTLYDGAKNFDNEYMDVTVKVYLLLLRAPFCGKNTTLLLPDASHSEPRRFNLCFEDLTVHMDIPCSHRYPCLPEVEVDGFAWHNTEVRGNEKGYVKEAMFMVMDNLLVAPAERFSEFSMKYEQLIKGVCRHIEKRKVTFGTAEAIKLLKASLSSKTVLTDVFLGGAVNEEN